jgi:hypothetical protein
MNRATMLEKLRLIEKYVPDCDPRVIARAHALVLVLPIHRLSFQPEPSMRESGNDSISFKWVNRSCTLVLHVGASPMVTAVTACSGLQQFHSFYLNAAFVLRLCLWFCKNANTRHAKEFSVTSTPVKVQPMPEVWAPVGEELESRISVFRPAAIARAEALEAAQREAAPHIKIIEDPSFRRSGRMLMDDDNDNLSMVFPCRPHGPRDGKHMTGPLSERCVKRRRRRKFKPRER